jgi:hypothetical protein
MASIYLESARNLLHKHGYAEAKRLCIQWRDMNSEGTASFAFHNATLKHLETARREEADDAEPFTNGPDTRF